MPVALQQLLWLPWVIASLTAIGAGAIAYAAYRKLPRTWFDQVALAVVVTCAMGFTYLLVDFRLLPPAQ